MTKPPLQAFQNAASGSVGSDEDKSVLFFLQLLGTLFSSDNQNPDMDAATASDAAMSDEDFNKLIKGLFDAFGLTTETVDPRVQGMVGEARSYARHPSADGKRQLGENFANYVSGLDGPISSVSGHILDMVASVESGGDYNIAYGGKRYDLGSMTVREVMDLQNDIVRKGGASSAMGRYQVMGFKLKELVANGVVSENDYFDKGTQNKIGLQLLKDRGFDAFMAGDLSASGFLRNLSKEWAGLPKDLSNQSNYEGIANNHAGMSGHKALGTLERVQAFALASRGDTQETPEPNATIHHEFTPNV